MSYIKHGLTRLDHFSLACARGGALNGKTLPQLFGRLTHSNRLKWSGDSNDLISIYEDLVDSVMTTANNDSPHAAGGMTFFAQFVDHDITMDATSKIGSVIDPRTIRNVRTPTLDLDCVYGDGPDGSPHLYGSIAGRHGFILFGREDSELDLARNCKGTALIGDPRNDENIYVSQVQGAFICLHNLILEAVYEEKEHAGTNDLGEKVNDFVMAATHPDVWHTMVSPTMSAFEITRHFIRLHYQWLVVHDMLPAFVDKAAIKDAFTGTLFGPSPAIMPVEFSGAAYRFGHATVQQTYRLANGSDVTFFENPGFGPRGPEADISMADYFGTKALPARGVGMSFAKDIFQLPFVQGGIQFGDVTISKEQAKKLPLRNILRDRFTLELASGQQMADLLGVDHRPAIPKVLADAGIEKTPLWIYCLQEAKDGLMSGVGGRIVASVFCSLLLCDEASYLHISGFRPDTQFNSMSDIMKFVEKNRDSLKGREELFCHN